MISETFLPPSFSPRLGCQNTIWLLGTFRLASSRISIQSRSKLDKGVLRSPIDKRPLLRRCSAGTSVTVSAGTSQPQMGNSSSPRLPACPPASLSHPHPIVINALPTAHGARDTPGQAKDAAIRDVLHAKTYGTLIPCIIHTLPQLGTSSPLSHSPSPTRFVVF